MIANASTRLKFAPYWYRIYTWLAIQTWLRQLSYKIGRNKIGGCIIDYDEGGYDYVAIMAYVQEITGIEYANLTKMETTDLYDMTPYRIRHYMCKANRPAWMVVVVNIDTQMTA